MPKSYIYDEPGAQRAERDGFDPFKQTLGRIQSFESIGHDAVSYTHLDVYKRQGQGSAAGQGCVGIGGRHQDHLIGPPSPAS